MPTYLKTIYDEKAKPYTGYPYNLCKYLFNRYKMKKGDNLLDVGCGRGDFAKGFRDLGLKVFGIDREKGSPEMLKGVIINLTEIEDGFFPSSDGTFDFVFSKSVIEHLWKPDNFIKEIYRVLKPGGRIIIMTPDWQSQRRIFYNDHTHVHPYTRESLKALLEIYEFKEAASELFYQLPVLWKYPYLKIFSKCLQISGPVKKIYKNKFIRFSRELMILGTGIKPKI